MNKGLEVIEAHELFGDRLRRASTSSCTRSPSSTRWSSSPTARRSPSSACRTCACRSATPSAGPTRIATPFGRDRLGGARRARLRAARSRPRSAASTSPTRPDAPAGRAPAWLSAANEVAVEAFLAGAIGWTQIADVCKAALDRHDLGMPTTVDDVVAADRAARERRHAGRERGRRMKTEWRLPPPDPATRNRYDRFRNEVMAGGSVTETPADEEPTGDAGRAPRRARHPRPARAGWPSSTSGCSSSSIGIIVSVFLHETRPLRHRPADGHEGDAVLPRLRAPPVELPARRDGVRRARPPARRVRAHHRHEQPRRGAAGGRGPHVPPADATRGGCSSSPPAR